MRTLCVCLVVAALMAPGNALASEDADETQATTAIKPRPAAETLRRSQIDSELLAVRDEAGSTPRLLPILTIALGTAAVLTAATSGAITAIGCDGSCSSGAWQGATIMGGAAVATLGILWLRWTNADLDEVDARRRRLERERHLLDASAGGPTAALTAQSRTLTLGVRTRF